MKVVDFPESVKEVKEWDENSKYSKLIEVLANESTTNSLDLKKMWLKFEKLEPYEDEKGIYGFRCHWVYRVLDRILFAQNTPAYYLMNAKDRSDLKSDIKKTSAELIKKYRTYDLDANIFFNPSKIRGNWHVYEDFRDEHKAQIDDDNIDKIEVSTIINFFSNRAEALIDDVTSQAKISKNVKAIYFIRKMYDCNLERYDKPHYSIIRVLSNALYTTEYEDSDIHKLCNR